MSNVLPVQQGSLGGFTWPLYDGDRPVNSVDRAARGDVLSAVGPAVLLPTDQPLDYQLLAHHELPTPYQPLGVLEQQMSFFSRHLAHEGPISAHLLQEMLLEQLDATAAATAAAAPSNQLAALLVQVPTLDRPAAAAAAAAGQGSESLAAPPQQQQQQQQQQRQQQPNGLPRVPAHTESTVAAEPAAAAAGHAGSAVLVVSVTGSARQQINLTVLQPGAIPPHLTAAAAAEDGSRGAGAAAGSGGRSGGASAGVAAGSGGRGGGASAGAAAGVPGSAAGGTAAAAPAAATAAADSVPVQLTAEVAAVLDLGAPVEQVGLQQLHMPIAPSSGVCTSKRQQQQQQQQQQRRRRQPVAMVWARCLHKVYAALVTATSMTQHTKQQQQQQQEGSSSAPAAAAAAGGHTVTHWQMVLLGVSVLPQPLLAAVWHPSLPAAVLASSDGSLWLASVQPGLILQALAHQSKDHNLQQQQGQLRDVQDPSSSAAAGLAVCLHPDDTLPRLQLQLQGRLTWLQAASSSAAAAAGGGSSSSSSSSGITCPLLLSTAAHPMQVLAACGGTLMRHDLLLTPDRSSSSTDSTHTRQHQQQLGSAAGTGGGPLAAGSASATAAAAAAAAALPGKLLLQLPAREAICALSTWSGTQPQWYQAATAGAAAGAVSTAAAGCVNVCHLAAVATNSRLLLLDLRKAAEEPLLIWQHSSSSSSSSTQPSLLLLLPAPPIPAAAAAACKVGCFRGRETHPRPPAAAAAGGGGGGGGGGTAGGVPSNAGDLLLAAADSTPAAARGGDGTLTAAAAAAAAAGGSEAPQGFDPLVYPSQMFQLGSESQGFGGLGDLGMFHTQASQVADPALWSTGPGLQQQQQQQQGQAGGTNVQQVRVFVSPASAAAAAAQQAAAAASTADAKHSNRRPGSGKTYNSNARNNSSSDTAGDELRGVIVYAAGTSGDILSVNFRLQWAAGLAPTPLLFGECVQQLTTHMQTLSTQGGGSSRVLNPAAAAADRTPEAARGNTAGTTGDRTAYGTQTGRAAAAGPAAAAAGSSAGQQLPGSVALSFVTKAMQKLALPPAQTAAAAAPAPAAKRVRQSVGGHSTEITDCSPLGAWQLPCVVQATTPSMGQIVARPVRHCVMGEVLQGLRLQRAAAAAARGDARSAAEVSLQPGAALDVTKSSLAQQTLDLMSSAPDTQGLALTPIPWCWSGGTARAVLLRCTADGDLCVQLCSTRQVKLANTGRVGVGLQLQQQQQQQQKRQHHQLPGSLAAGAIAAADGGGRNGSAAALQQQQQHTEEACLHPCLEIVTTRLPQPPPAVAAAVSTAAGAAVAAGSSAPALAHSAAVPQADTHRSDPQQQQQQQLQVGCGQVCPRSFTSLQSWLDCEVEPPPLHTAAAAAGGKAGRPSSAKRSKEQQHLERQVVQLPAHTQLVKALAATQQQQQQPVSRTRSAAAAAGGGSGGSAVQQQQQHEGPERQAAACAGSDIPAVYQWPQPTAAADDDRASAAVFQGSALALQYSLLHFQSPEPDSGAAAAAARSSDFDTIADVLSEAQTPKTLLELQHALLKHHQQQQQQHGLMHAGQGRASRSSRKRPLSEPADQQQPGQNHRNRVQAAAAAGEGERPATRAAAAAAAAGDGTSRQPSVNRALSKLAQLRATQAQLQQQQQQQRGQPASRTRSAAAAAAGSSAAAAAVQQGQLHTADLSSLLQQELPDSQLQLAARLLAEATPPWSDPQQQQQQQGRAGDGSGLLQQLHELHKTLQLACGAPSQQQQQQRRRRRSVEQAVGQDPFSLQQYEVRLLTVPVADTQMCSSTWSCPQQQQQQTGHALHNGTHPHPGTHPPQAAAAAVGDGQPVQPGMRYTVQPVGPGVWDPADVAGLQLTGAPLDLTRVTGAPVLRHVQQQQQQQSTSAAAAAGHAAPGSALLAALAGGGARSRRHTLPKQQEQQHWQQQQGVGPGVSGGGGGGGSEGVLGDVGEALLGTQTQMGPEALHPTAAAAVGVVGSRVVAAEYAPLGALIQQHQAAEQLCDITPRTAPQQQQQQQGQFAAAAAGGGGGGSGAGVSPPGLLALAMSESAQQQWLQLLREWDNNSTNSSNIGPGRQPGSQHTPAAAAAAAGGEAAAAAAGGAAEGSRQKRQKREQQQQQQRRELAQGDRVQYIALGQQQDQQQKRSAAAAAAAGNAAAPGSALLAALAGGGTAARSRTLPQQQQQQSRVQPLAAGQAQQQQHRLPQSTRYTTLLPAVSQDEDVPAIQPGLSQPLVATQQQQQGSGLLARLNQQQQQQGGGLLARLSQQQQQRKPTGGSGGTSLLPPNRRR